MRKAPAKAKRGASKAERSPVTRYARQVAAGKVPACKWHRLACQRHLEDLRQGPKRGLRFDPEAADYGIGFFRFLRHSKGEFAGREFVLEPLQQFLVGSLWGWRRQDGFRRFREVYFEEPRKNGKSTLAAGIGLALFVADDEPGAEVYTAATKRDQAKIIHEEAIRMVKASPELLSQVSVFVNNLSVEATNSKYEPLGADKDTLDGLNVHGGTIDEYHAHKDAGVYNALKFGMSARRQPLLFVITTAGLNQQSPCFERHEYARHVLEGEFTDDAFFAMICAADEGDDWQSEETWYKANPNLGVCKYVDSMIRKRDEALQSPVHQNEFLNKDLNIWTQQIERYIPMEAWDRRSDPIDLEEVRSRPCYAGLDLSSTVDVTALVMVWPPEDAEGEFVVVPRFWIPGEQIRERALRDGVPYDVWAQQGLVETTEGNVIHYGLIQKRVEELAEAHRIVEIGFDQWGAMQMMQELDAMGLKVVPMRQGRTLSAATKEVLRLVLDDRLHHGGHPVLRWMADCLSVKRDEHDNLWPVKPDRGKSTARIDGMVALIMALDRALRKEVETASVYETRGPVVI